MTYRINASLVGATVIGAVCIIMEAVALAHDMQFNDNLKNNRIFKPNGNCSFFPSHSGQVLRNEMISRKELERNLACEPISIAMMMAAVFACTMSIIVTICCWKTKTTKTVILTNKIVAFFASLAFATAGILLSISIHLYDKHYIEYNGNQYTVCNMGRHFTSKAGTDCDNEYKICQRKVLKVSVTVLAFLCSIFGMSAAYTEFHVSPVIEMAKNTKGIDELIFSAPTPMVIEDRNSKSEIALESGDMKIITNQT